MTDSLASKLEQLDSSVDYTDPNTYQQLLYGEEGSGAPAPAAAPQGDSQPAAPAAITSAPPAPAADPAPAAAPATDGSSATPGAAENGDARPPVDGVLTRDGKHVIPYSVLEKTRETALENERRARQLEESNRRLQEQIDALAAGKGETGAGQPVEVFSRDRIEAVRADFPEMAELMESQNRLAAELAEARRAAVPAQPAAATEDQRAAVQAAIDNRPLLAKWQAESPLLFGRATEIDDALRNDPAWAAKPLDDRFAEVERRLAAEIGVPVQAPSPAASAAPTPPSAPASPPSAALATPAVVPAPRPGIGDFNGSAPVVDGDPLLGVPVGQAVDRAMSMSVEDLMRSVGVNV